MLRLAGRLAQVKEALLELYTIRVAVLIAQNYKARLRILVATNLADNLFFQVLLTLEGNQPEADARHQQARQ
ncbi:hypothetical protein D3C78_1893960 [compost metagenome]